MSLDFARSRASKPGFHLILFSCLLAGGAGAAPQEEKPKRPAAAQQANQEPRQAVRSQGPAPLAETCTLLDNPKARPIMDGLLKHLLENCGRSHELGQVSSETVLPVESGSAVGDLGKRVGSDVSVSDPSGDAGTEVTQNETAMAVNEITGTVCAAHNDSYHGIVENQGFSGFARSTDSGASFVDQGAIGPGNNGDPALVWRRTDGNFYYAALSGGGLAIWRSDDDCQTFTSIGPIANSGADDKELMAVDNNIASAFYGRLYVHWTDFTNGGIFSTFSDDEGTSWSTPVRISEALSDVQGAWPAVAPNGNVFSSWVRFGVGSTISIEVARSTDGGVTWSLMADPATDRTSGQDSLASFSCGRPALNGNLRYLPSPQIAVGPNGDLHVVYSYDPDGGGPDTIDVFYRRSTDGGATWQPEIRVNDDATTKDQFFPTLSVGASNRVSVGFYDRRNDVDNLLYEYFQASSPDGGLNWLPNLKISDQQSSVVLDPSLATCYHGDYDTHVQIADTAILQWSDDRDGNANTFSDTVSLDGSFLVVPSSANLEICAPDDAVTDLVVTQFDGFVEPVTLAEEAWPVGLSGTFGTNPVTPPDSSTLTISGTANVGFGNYALSITGTSAPSGIVQNTSLSLAVVTQVPGAPTPKVPADNAPNLDVQPTFIWTASAEAYIYTLEVAADEAFLNIIYQETTSELGLRATSPLPGSSELFWRVRAENTCGQSAYSSVFSFNTRAVPGDCPQGLQTVDLFVEDFESGANGWTTGGMASTWALEAGPPAQSGAQAFQADNLDVVSDQYLISRPYLLPSTTPLTLFFWTRHDINFEGNTSCFDGGRLEISTDGGSSWTPLGVEILQQTYDGRVRDSLSNPLEGELVWCGFRDWSRFVVDLGAFGGQTAQLRFRLATGLVQPAPGWWIDDVSISTCGLVEIFVDGFESGTTNAWSSSP